MNQENRGPWYLFTGLALGIILGLVYSWLISPVEYVDTDPSLLRGDFKDQYRTLIAVAYLADNDLSRASARLALLKDPDTIGALSLQAQVALNQGRPESETNALKTLGLALSQGSSSQVATAPPLASATATAALTPSPTPTQVVSILSTLETPTPTPTEAKRTASAGSPTPTMTALPTRTATPTPGAGFVLIDQSLVCTQGTASLIQVEAQDAAGQPIPGVEIVINWSGGEEHFFTGLKPELGPGYADFNIQPGVSYDVRLADGGEPVPALQAVECEADGGVRYWGSWKLVFRQP